MNQKTETPVQPRAAWFYRYRGFLSALPALLMLFSPGKLRWSGCGGLLLVSAFFLRVWARMHAGEHTRGRSWDAEELVVAGPYARMRHPIYLSNLLAGWGLLFFSGAPALWLVVLGLLWVAQNRVLGNAEDRYLLDRFKYDWWFWACATPFWGWGSQKVSEPILCGGEVDCSEKRRSFGAAVVADRWSWFWQLLLLALLASSLRGTLG